jgi:hypothetical protein
MIINQQISMKIIQTVIYLWISSPFQFPHHHPTACMEILLLFDRFADNLGKYIVDKPYLTRFLAYQSNLTAL